MYNATNLLWGLIRQTSGSLLSKMEVLESLSSILVDIVRNIKFEEGKHAFIREHIKNATSESFPPFTLPSGKDWFNVARPLTDADISGKIVILDFFTYCCINCLHLLPHLKSLEEMFPPTEGLVVIGVHNAKFENEKKSSNIASALKRLNITHPVVNDSDGFLWTQMKVFCWPTIVILGPTGQALFMLTGEQNPEELFLIVETTLNFYANEIRPNPIPISLSQSTLTSNILNFPAKITRFGNLFAVSVSGDNRILIIDDSAAIRYKIGSKLRGHRDGTFEQAEFNSPQGVAFYNESKLYVADTENHVIRLIDLEKREVKTVIGTTVQGKDLKGGKVGTSQEISSPWDLCFVSSSHIHIACNSVGAVGVHHPDTHAKSQKKCSTSPEGLPPPPPPPPRRTVSLPHYSAVPSTSQSSPEEHPDFGHERGESSNNVLLIAMCGTHQIWAYFLEDTIWWKGTKYLKDVCAAIAGSGREENRNNTYPMQAAFAQPSGLAYSPSQACVFVADSESSSIRKISLEDGTVSHVVGGDRNPVNLFNFGDVDGVGFEAKLQHPLGLAFKEREDALYVCDTYNNKLKKVNMANLECSSIGEGRNLLNEPGGCVFDEEEDILFIADTNNHNIAIYNLNDGTLKNWVLDDFEPLEEVNVNYDHEWDLEAEVSRKGGLLIMNFQLKPDDINGSFKFDLNESNFVAKENQGSIHSVPFKLELKILPADPKNTDTAKLFLTLTYCDNHVCILKKCVITLKVNRTDNEDEVTTVEFQKTIGS